MTNQGEGSMDEITRIVDKAENDDKEVKRKGGYKGLIGSQAQPSSKVASPSQPVVQKSQETIGQNPLEKEIEEAFAEKNTAAARKFRQIANSVTDPQNQDPFKKD
jgi:hypothetical protein